MQNFININVWTVYVLTIIRYLTDNPYNVLTDSNSLSYPTNINRLMEGLMACAWTTQPIKIMNGNKKNIGREKP